MSTVEQALQSLRAGATTASELVENALTLASDVAGEGARVFVRRFDQSARHAADAADALTAGGLPPLPLQGLPVVVKDSLDVAGTVTTAGSVVLRDRPAARRDAPVVARLRAAGAIVLGSTNMTEFAMGGVGINPHYGTPLNPFDRKTKRIPGGSSSGSAVAVADGIVLAAIGTDTAGSIQMPSALCGVTGFKPSAYRVPLEGCIPLAPSLDSIGPIARSVECCAIVDAILAEECDLSLLAFNANDIHLAMPKTLVFDELDAPVAAAMSRAISLLAEAGVRITEISLSELGELPSLGYAVVEGYAWHRRLLETHRELYDPIIAARFASGSSISAADYIDLNNTRQRLIASAAKATRSYDALLMPTVPIVAPAIAAIGNDETAWLATNRRLIRNPVVANFLDRCALSLPCHAMGEAPVGLSLVGGNGEDRRLLGIGRTIEAVLRKGGLGGSEHHC